MIPLSQIKKTSAAMLHARFVSIPYPARPTGIRAAATPATPLEITSRRRRRS